GQLWLLQGGPGGSASAFYSLIDVIQSRRPELDIYTLEHRGVGSSTELDCPAQTADNSDGGPLIAPNEVTACVAAVQASVGGALQQFTTSQAARDLAHVIDRTKAQGQRVFIYGVSYGTYWVQRYLQLFPTQASAAILDSILPPVTQFENFDAQ